MTTKPSLKITEAQFQSQVLDLAHLLGWRVAHFRPAMTKHGWRTAVAGNGKGFPDLIMVRGDRQVVAELKSKTGFITGEQKLWLDAFRGAGVETYVWRPDDFEEIKEVLG